MVVSIHLPSFYPKGKHPTPGVQDEVREGKRGPEGPQGGSDTGLEGLQGAPSAVREGLCVVGCELGVHAVCEGTE